MKNYFIYHTTTGEIIQTGSMPAYALDMQQLPENCLMAEGIAVLGQHRYSNGELIDISPPAIDELLAWRERTEVSRFQAYAALYQAGYLEPINTYMLSADPIVKIAWEAAQTFRRNSSCVLAMQPELGLTNEQLDDLFRFALTITG